MQDAFSLQDLFWQKMCGLWPWYLIYTRGMNFFPYHILCIISWDWFCILCTIQHSLSEWRLLEISRSFIWVWKHTKICFLKWKHKVFIELQMKSQENTLLWYWDSKSQPYVPTSTSVRKSWFLISTGLELPSVCMCILKTRFQTSRCKGARRDYYNFKTWETGLKGKERKGMLSV